MSRGLAIVSLLALSALAACSPDHHRPPGSGREFRSVYEEYAPPPPPPTANEYQTLTVQNPDGTTTQRAVPLPR